jgi:hypothetical protein
MKKLFLVSLLVIIASSIHAQKLISKTGHIWFYSATPIEEIEAHNYQVACILDTKTGEIQVSLLIRSFEFKIELMQEHFNENYMESDLFPKASLKGNVTNIADINITKDGEYTAKLKGDLTIHGVTKPIETTGTITVVKGVPTIKAKIIVLTADYNIQIPDLVKEKIAKEIEVNIEIPFQP